VLILFTQRYVTQYLYESLTGFSFILGIVFIIGLFAIPIYIVLKYFD